MRSAAKECFQIFAMQKFFILNYLGFAERRIYNQKHSYSIPEEVNCLAKCEHKSCGSSEKVWLPYVFQGRELGLKPHPYCSDCGAVKSLSSERPREIGFYVNIVVALSKDYKIAQVQKRLIALEMIKLELDDKYALDRHQQEKLFIEIVKKYVNVPEVILRGKLEH